MVCRPGFTLFLLFLLKIRVVLKSTKNLFFLAKKRKQFFMCNLHFCGNVNHNILHNLVKLSYVYFHSHKGLHMDAKMEFVGVLIT